MWNGNNRLLLLFRGFLIVCFFDYYYVEQRDIVIGISETASLLDKILENL